MCASFNLGSITRREKRHPANLCLTAELARVIVGGLGAGIGAPTARFRIW
jgi:hypothetical protein